MVRHLFPLRHCSRPSCARARYLHEPDTPLAVCLKNREPQRARGRGQLRQLVLGVPLLEDGDPHYQMGRQHALQVRSLRALIYRAIASRRAELARLEVDYRSRLEEAVAFMAERDGATWKMMEGIADGLELDRETMHEYVFSSYLLDLYRSESLQDGCTVLAVSGQATRTGETLLAKNRDYLLGHMGLQILARTRPVRGYRYVQLGSAGSPGVFSSGMNECGLAVADTHVPSSDLGPGLPRWALMLDLLEKCADVPSALDYLRAVPQMGGGTVTLADAAGRLVVWESGHGWSGYVVAESGWLVSTNHFTTAGLRDQWRESGPAELRGNSEARRAYAEQALSGAGGEIDLPWVEALLSHHDSGLARICRHGRPDSRVATILSTIFLPARREMILSVGNPCKRRWVTVTDLFVS